jgi:hypothetical protein
MIENQVPSLKDQRKDLLLQKIRVLIALGIRPSLAEEDYNELIKDSKMKQTVKGHVDIQKDVPKAF